MWAWVQPASQKGIALGMVFHRGSPASSASEAARSMARRPSSIPVGLGMPFLSGFLAPGYEAEMPRVAALKAPILTIRMADSSC